jgi:predicted dehydrogenase
MALRCGIVGLGYWGPNILRNLVASPSASVIAVCDSNADRCSRMAKQFAIAQVSCEPIELFKNPNIDAVFIATPVSTHYSLVMAALRAGKHVFVEKPLASDLGHAEEMAEEAARRGLCLMVDHIFVYSSAVQKIRELVKDQQIGDVLYYDSVRVNLGLFQSDVNVIWDLVVHDLSILDFVLDARPIGVLTQARAHVKGQPENMAYMTCIFDSPLIAHFHVNWLAPVKIRRTLLGGTRRMIVYDDLEPDEKIKIYDRGVDLTSAEPDNTGQQFGYRLGDMSAPMLDRTEALHRGIHHFVDCIAAGKSPITDGQCGVRIVRLLAAASRSIKCGGRMVLVDD